MGRECPMREIAAKDMRRVLDLVHAVHENTTAVVLPQQVLAAGRP
ncbi:hypothetical protein [Lentzea roselyniae]